MTEILTTNMQTTRSIDLKLHGDISNGCPAEIAIGNSMQIIDGEYQPHLHSSLVVVCGLPIDHIGPHSHTLTRPWPLLGDVVQIADRAFTLTWEVTT